MPRCGWARRSRGGACKMLAKGPARKVTIYLNEDTRHHAAPLYEAVLDLLRRKGVAGATVTRALAGFGPAHTLHTSKIELLAEHLPVRIEFVDTPAKVEEVLPALYDMVTDGLIEAQDTTVLKAATKERPRPGPHHERRAPAKLLRIFIDEHQDYDAVIQRLRMLDIAGATVYRGVFGPRGKPVMISVVDAPDQIARAVAAREETLQEALLAMSDVETISLLRGGADDSR